MYTMKLKLAHVPFYMQPTVLLLFVSVKKHNSENILLGHFFTVFFMAYKIRSVWFLFLVSSQSSISCHILLKAFTRKDFVEHIPQPKYIIIFDNSIPIIAFFKYSTEFKNELKTLKSGKRYKGKALGGSWAYKYGLRIFIRAPDVPFLYPIFFVARLRWIEREKKT